jgi:hypothetical protein
LTVRLISIDKYERAYLLTSDTEKEMSEWIQALLKVTMDAVQPATPSNSSFSLTNEEEKEYQERIKRLSKDKEEVIKARASTNPEEKNAARMRKRQNFLSTQRVDAVVQLPVHEEHHPVVSRFAHSLILLLITIPER